MTRRRHALRAARRFAARLHADERGAELISFALTLPVLLLMGLGGLEIASFGIANLRVSQIAMTAADNAGRVRDQITEGDINEIMTGAKFVGRSIGFADHGRIIISSLESRTDVSGNNPNNYQWIRWQRCAGAKNASSSYGTPETSGGAVISDGTEAFRTDGVTASSAPSNQAKSTPGNGTVDTQTGMGPQTSGRQQVAAAPGTAVMFVEVVYDYQPVVANRWISETQISAVRAFNVRQRTDQQLKFGTVAYADIARCNKFTA
ncbi:pilus assembly protein [Sphingomonas profundi]|uniref:pilus assembly protein n=1 Tax=Alterirhizorhabdus profundi TaxID=2681549 RepID=UPI0018CFFC70|nr:pilus assembly protein [Sphingomonas profundi]